MKKDRIEHIDTWYQHSSEKSLVGRRILLQDIEPLLLNLPSPFKVSKAGSSEMGKDIYNVTLGHGPKRILLWTQMHGNESTGTKALFDLFNYLKDQFIANSDFAKDLINKCTLVFIPMLNPDGSEAFTRVNSKQVDLNRDAVDQQAVESKLLRSILDNFKPHFCFNLHDQRTIFNVEGFKNPATISFLAPSEDEERTLTTGRKETMAAIVAMNNTLQQLIPNHVGRYTDEFYPTATGDNFQKLGHNTILIEAGHYPNDYDRDLVRKFNFYALVSGLEYLIVNDKYTHYQPYFDIPNNGKQNYDLIIRNFLDDKNQKVDVAFQYEYEVVNNQLISKLVEYDRGDLSSFYAYQEF
ncbi:M14 family zinc carboxypeptidase [Ochrovirga pacifica]|uniref:M14 family zinc carboxypeptidase n=1 Tax=Ochrovirga pacifica TaxID=1042376 RepID=UPI0002557BAE|nr:M14 family zinc carboxypeptidase [Ochrovirga pacifica]